MDEALALLETLAARVPADGRVALEWGRTLAGWADDPVGARAQLDRALEVAPGLSAARFERALLALSVGEAALALADLDLLLQGSFRQHVLLHLHRARALEQLGRLEDAYTAWSAALEAGTPGAWLLLQRARLDIKLGRHDRAEIDLGAALEIEREAGEDADPELLLERARVRVALGLREAAREDLHAAQASLWHEETALASQVEALRRTLEALD